MIGKLFWSFNFRNIGLVPILKTIKKPILIDTRAQLQTTLRQMMLLRKTLPRILNERLHTELRYSDYENRNGKSPNVTLITLNHNHIREFLAVIHLPHGGAS